MTALMLAADCGHSEVARLLIAAGAGMDFIDRSDMTALNLASTSLRVVTWRLRVCWWKLVLIKIAVTIPAGQP